MTTRRNHSSLEGSGAPAVRRGPREWRLLEWQVVDEQSFRLARLMKLSLGKLPQRLAKFGKARFDLEEERKYGIGQDEKVAGRDLAGLAAYLVRCAAKPPADYMMSLKGIPAALIEPMKAYLRVKLALGRLEAEIEAVRNDLPKAPSSPTVIPEFAEQISGTTQERAEFEVHGIDQCAIKTTKTPKPTCFKTSSPAPRSRIFSTENSGMTESGARRSDVQPKKPKSFTWDISPAKAYGFKEMTAAYGYDPRDTSTYWIEKRANALRRKWAAHGQEQIGESRAVAKQSGTKSSNAAATLGSGSAPVVRHFQPVDADYNTVWPPIELPGGPPKYTKPFKPSSPPLPTVVPGFAMQLSGTSHRLADFEARGIDECGLRTIESPKPILSAKSPTPLKPEASSSQKPVTTAVCEGVCFATAEENTTVVHPSGLQIAAFGNEADDSNASCVTYQNTAPVSPEFAEIQRAAIAARKQAEQTGCGLIVPPEYAAMFGSAAIRTFDEKAQKFLPNPAAALRRKI